MGAHTPGPWVHQIASNYIGYSIAPQGLLPTLAAVERCGDSNITVTCFNFPGETEANARLISAAPDLLDTYDPYADLTGPDFLEWVADRLVLHGDSPNADFILTLRRKADKARAAIAKATGAKS